MITGASQAAAAEQSQGANPVMVTTPEPDPDPVWDAVVGLRTEILQRIRPIVHPRDEREAAVHERMTNDRVNHIIRPYSGMSDDCLYGMLQELSKEAHERYIERTERAFPVGEGIGAAVNLQNWGNEPTPAAQPRVAQVGQPPRRD